MGFFNLADHAVEPQRKELKGLSTTTLHELGCKVCPLYQQRGLTSPQMEPSGSDQPVVYMLGEAPSFADDANDDHFSDKAGKLLRRRIPRAWLPKLRWNNITRTHQKGGNRNDVRPLPPPVAVEACRKSIVEDIERTKPFAIFGFGAGPLRWALDESGIIKWAGRHIPVQIGKHRCWFFPMLDPHDVLKQRRWEPRNPSDYGSDTEFQMHLHLRKAFELVDVLPEPTIISDEDAVKSIEYVMGDKPGDLDKVLDYLDRCYDAREFGFDYETNKIRPYDEDGKAPKILTVGLALEDSAFAFPIDHPQAKWSKRDKEMLLEELYLFLRNAKGNRAVHELQFELEWTAVFFGRECVVGPAWQDTASQAYILDERQWSFKLDFLSLQHFGTRMKSHHVIDRTNMEASDLATCLSYNAEDARFHLYLYRRQRRYLKTEGLTAVYKRHLKRVPTMALSSVKGVPVDHKHVATLKVKYEEELRKIEDKLFAVGTVANYRDKKGEKFNPNNNHHILAILRKRGFKAVTKTQDAELSKIDDEFAKLVREWRKPNKLYTTYIMPLVRGSENCVVYDDGMLHPVIRTTKTRTWRTSSEDPNIQNWPKRGEKVSIRRMIKHRDETKIIVAIDYAGIQARNVAMESLDRALVDIYWRRYDIHKDWTERLLRRVPKWKPVQSLGKIDEAKRFKEYRSVVKNSFVFPCFFGAQAKSLAKYLGIDERPAQDLRDEFFDKFPEVEVWQKRIIQFYKREGYVTGLTGFRRRAPISPNELINAPIQADESEIVCLSMAALAERSWELTANWMIHDDLSWVWRKGDLERNLEIVAPEMVKWRRPWMRACPLEIEVSIGQGWNELKEIAKYETTRDGGCREIVENKK